MTGAFVAHWVCVARKSRKTGAGTAGRKKKKAQTTQRRFFRLEGGHTLGLLLVTQLKVLAPGKRLVRLVFAGGALEAEDHLLGGLGLRGGSNRGATTHRRGKRRQKDI